jgi:hypothetical protein
MFGQILGELLSYLVRVILAEISEPREAREGHETVWSQAREETTTLANDRAIVFGLLTLPPSAALGALGAVLTSSSPLWLQLFAAAMGTILGFAAAVGVIFAVKAVVFVPVSQRDLARSERDAAKAEIAELQKPSEFPNVEFRAGHPIILGPQDSATSIGGKGETLIVMRMRVMNREPNRKAIIEFKAGVQTELRGVVSTRRVFRGGLEPILPELLKLDPEDVDQGDLCFCWDHDMDFLIGRDLPHDAILQVVADGFHLAAYDHLSTVSVPVELPKGWGKL